MTSTKIIGGTDYNYINALTDVFYYKKSLISYIIAYIVISKAFNIFGNNGGIISLIIVLLIYFKILKIPLFNSPELDPSKFGDLSDYIMAEKSCGPVSTLNNNRPTKTKKVKKNNVVVQETDTPEIIPENNTEINPENNTEIIPENNTEINPENNTENNTEIIPEIQENDLTNSESSNVELFPITGNISNVESENIPKIETISIEPQIEPIVETQPQIEPTVETQHQIEPKVETQPQIEPTVETQPQIEPTVETQPQIEPTVETQTQIEPIVETQPQIEPISVEPQIQPDTTSKIEPTSVETARILPNSLI
jgi:hypothetical protein